MQPSNSGLFVTCAYLPHTTLPDCVTRPNSLTFTSKMVPFVITPKLVYNGDDGFFYTRKMKAGKGGKHDACSGHEKAIHAVQSRKGALTLTPKMSKQNVVLSSGWVMWAFLNRKPVGRMNRSYLGALRVNESPTNVTCPGKQKQKSEARNHPPSRIFPPTRNTAAPW